VHRDGEAPGGEGPRRQQDHPEQRGGGEAEGGERHRLAGRQAVLAEQVVGREDTRVDGGGRQAEGRRA
jgi:hypothetical protein